MASRSRSPVRDRLRSGGTTIDEDCDHARAVSFLLNQMLQAKEKRRDYDVTLRDGKSVTITILLKRDRGSSKLKK